MRFYNHKEFWIFALFLFSGVALLYFIKNSAFFDQLIFWTKDNFLLFFTLLVLIKFISIVYPPLTGGLFTMASIAIIGWQFAFLADFIGSTLGGVINYFLGRKYGKRIVLKFMGQTAVDKLDEIKITKGREIEGLIVLRVISGSFVLELIHYVAGILKISFDKYLIAMVISQIITGIPLFYLMGNILDDSNLIVMAVSVVILIIGMPLLYKLKDRYLE